MAQRVIRILTTLAMALAGIVSVTALTAGPVSAKDLDCADFPNQAAAQRNLNANPGDPNGLDAEGDGIACESLPCPCFYGTTNGPTPPKSNPTPKPKPAPKAVLRVVKVVTGDLVRVQFGNAKPYLVHPLGATVPKNACKRRAARTELRSYLKPGNVIALQTDRKAPNRDDARALLRYLIKVQGKGGFNVGLTQVADGYAETDETIKFGLKKKYVRLGEKAAANAAGYFSTCQ